MSCQCGHQDEAAKREALEKVFAHYRGTKGALIPLLQEAQEIYGYLPGEVMRRIAAELKIPYSKVFGVATFYAQFHLKPRGRNVIRVCQGTACHVRGGAAIYKQVRESLALPAGEDTTADLRFTLETVACIGACGLAPVLSVNDDTYGRLVPEQINDILKNYA